MISAMPPLTDAVKEILGTQWQLHFFQIKAAPWHGEEE